MTLFLFFDIIENDKIRTRDSVPKRQRDPPPLTLSHHRCRVRWGSGKTTTTDEEKSAQLGPPPPIDFDGTLSSPPPSPHVHPAHFRDGATSRRCRTRTPPPQVTWSCPVPSPPSGHLRAPPASLVLMTKKSHETFPIRHITPSKTVGYLLPKLFLIFQQRFYSMCLTMSNASFFIVFPVLTRLLPLASESCMLRELLVLTVVIRRYISRTLHVTFADKDGIRVH